MKVFISVGMSNRKDEAVASDIDRASSIIHRMFGDSVEIVHNWDCPEAPEKSGRLWYLSNAIRTLGECDACFFVSGWENYTGCKTEQFICEGYGIMEIYEDERLTPKTPIIKTPI